MTFNPLRSKPPVIVPPRKALTKAEKVAVWNAANGLCWWCGKPVALEGLGVAYDHRLARGLSADDTTENLAPMHAEPCHAEKTHGKTGDIARVAHAKRQEKLTRPKERKPGGFRGWRRFDGSPVHRENTSTINAREED